MINYNKLISKNDISIIYFFSKDFNILNIKINEIKKLYPENINYIDIDKEYDIISKLNIKSAPLFRIYKNNEIIEEIFGNNPDIVNILKVHL